MKKNRMMRLASLMLVLVLMTSCVISGTFAKYTTEKTGTDSARVAKWGVEIIANGTTFAKEYDTDDAVFTEAKSVISTDKVVAPGTYGNMVSMALSGTPEVAVSVTYEATLVLTGWAVDGDANYCPIIFTVNGVEYFIGKTGINDVATLIVEVEKAIENYSANYAPNQNLATETTVATPDVSWKWEFVGNTVTTQTDVNDTALGNAANPATIDLTVKTIVTQIN